MVLSWRRSVLNVSAGTLVVSRVTGSGKEGWRPGDQG